MTKEIKVLVALLIVCAFFLGGYTFRSPLEALAAQLYHTVFDQSSPTSSGGTSVGVASAAVIQDDNLNRQYLSLINSGSANVSCFPSSTAGTYGGGWWLVANGGAISFDGTTIYGGLVTCITGSGTTTVAWVER